MCKQVAEGRRDNRFIYFYASMSCFFAVGMACAAELPDVLTASERIDKMSAMGVLAFGFILSMAGLIYLIRLQYGRMLTVIDKNTEAVQGVIDAIEKCTHGK